MDKEIIEIYEQCKNIILPLLGSGLIACEITPIIKIKPITTFLGWLGKKLNKDVQEDIKQLKKDVKTVQIDLQVHKVESWRRDILSFADSLMMGREKTKEQYKYIISIHDNYEKYINEHGLENGQVDLAYSFIQKKYHENLENNSFYTGK